MDHSQVKSQLDQVEKFCAESERRRDLGSATDQILSYNHKDLILFASHLRALLTEHAQISEQLQEATRRLNAERQADTPDFNSMRPMSDAPLDGTPILVKIKDDLSPWGIVPGDFGSTDRFAGHYAVMRNFDDIMAWRFAAPVGRGGFSADWLDGWWPIPQK